MKQLNIKTVNISLPKATLDVLDGIAEVENRNRSEMLRAMILAYAKDVIQDPDAEEYGTEYTVDEFAALLGKQNKGLMDAFKKLMR